MINKIAENRRWLYLVAMVTACLPLSLGYLPEKGELLLWANRVMEMSASFPRIAFFPQSGEIDSNLYLFLPALIYRLTKSVVLSYIVTVALVHLVTATGMFFLMKQLYEEPLEILLGVTLYLLCPYRLHLCYEQADLVLCAVWALIPWYLYGLYGKKRGLWISTVAIALIGYGSSVMLVLLLVLTPVLMLFSEAKRGWVSVMASVAVGLFLWLPQGIRFFQYLFTDAFDGWGMELMGIAAKGYAISDYLLMYRIRDGRPGFGLGLLFAVILLFWSKLIRGEKTPKKNNGFALIVLLCLWAANHYFPWDMVQRVDECLLKLVSLMETPVLFFGFASLFLALLVPAVVQPLLREKETLPARGCLVIVWLASVGSAIFYCNGLFGYYC